MLPPALGSPTNAVASLSRAFAREIENLPTRYLREFYKIKVGDDIRALPSPKSPTFKARYKRVSRELRKLEAANNGSNAAYQHVLFLAYGRKGKLRRELMEPLLGDPSVPLPPPIIPPVESSRPPVYSPEITALLESNLSHRGTSRTPKQLEHPPILPPRADPESSDAKILGPLSKRREVNLRWKFFEAETAKVWPPIEVSRVHAVEPPAPLDKPPGSEGADTVQPAPPAVGFLGTSVLRDLESIASPNPNVPKRNTNPSLPNPTNYALPTSTVNRFIRRQHRKLLRKIPILTYFKHPKSPVGKYEVSLSPLASSGLLVELTSNVPMADEADLAWLRLPPPSPKPVVKLESPPSQEPKVDRNPRPYGELRSRGSDWVDDDDPTDERRPKEEEAEGEPREMRSEADRDPQTRVKRTRTVRSYPLRSERTDEPPNQLKHRSRDRPPWNSARSEDPKKPRRFGGTTGDKLQREEPPSRSSPPVLNGVKLFKGSLAGGGFGKPPPKL